MPTRSHYVALAKQVRGELNASGLAFRSYRRREFTDRLREVSGEPSTRIKTASMAPDIEDAFRDQGLRVFPRLTETSTNDEIRVWRAGTVAAEILDLILNPGTESDRQLGSITQKVKGKFEWTAPFPPDDAANGGDGMERE